MCYRGLVVASMTRESKISGGNSPGLVAPPAAASSGNERETQRLGGPRNSYHGFSRPQSQSFFHCKAALSLLRLLLLLLLRLLPADQACVILRTGE
ncbi:hypothetical protein SDJN03_29804, partial [Cucurbita argyrosperma subsp. sororia]